MGGVSASWSQPSAAQYCCWAACAHTGLGEPFLVEWVRRFLLPLVGEVIGVHAARGARLGALHNRFGRDIGPRGWCSTVRMTNGWAV